MFSFSLCASLTTLIASAVAVSAAPGLSVKTSTPNDNVDGLENLKVTTTIINTGNESLKLLNDPRGVLSPFPENTFIITNTARSRRPWFNGAMVNYSPTYAAGLDDPSVFTVLAPGASIDITHDLSATYNFTLSGTGNYSIEPLSLFTYLDVNGTLKDLHATVEDIAEVTLSGNLIVSRALDRRGGEFRACSPEQAAVITLAIDGARGPEGPIKSAIDALEAMVPGYPSLRWTTWFGPVGPCDVIYVRAVFQRVREDLLKYNYRCSLCIGSFSVTSYVLESEDLIILCPYFFNDLKGAVGPESRAGALIHEATHFIGKTGHTAVGEFACRILALGEFGSDPKRCIWNADSYRYFAEDPDSWPNPHDNAMGNLSEW